MKKGLTPNFGIIGNLLYGSTINAQVQMSEKGIHAIIVDEGEELKRLRQEEILKHKLNKLQQADVIIVGKIEEDDSFEVNGVQYRPIQKQKAKNFLDLIIPYGDKYERKLSSDINIIEEFGLIQNKKSRLSKWERDEVVFIFGKTYKKVTE
jgi:hypothetical protein